MATALTPGMDSSPASTTMKTAFHIDTGPHQMYEIDANGAVGHHPQEWSFGPWSADETNAYRQKRYEEKKRLAEQNGLPPPAPPETVQLSEQDAQELDDDETARAEAAELVAEADKREAEQRDYDRRVAEARALLASPRRTIIPTAEQSPARQRREQVQIPDGWKDLSGPKRRSLAMKLGAPVTVTVPEADSRIESEISRRAGNANAQPSDASPSVDANANVQPSEKPPEPRATGLSPKANREADVPAVSADTPVSTDQPKIP